MAIVRQMAELYIRGNLANVTMKQLTDEERQQCDRICDIVANHNGMKKHKIQVVRMLGETIRADYRENREAAEQEYYIAIWRAVVNLLFHKHYKFQCSNCKATDRITKSKGISNAIDQMFVPCPVCNHALDHDNNPVLVKKSDDISSFTSTIKALVILPTTEDIKNNMSKLSNKELDRYSKGYRYYDPDKILNDDTQLIKFFGEFVWGYFKQQLNENNRTIHNKRTTISGRLDELIMMEILELCRKLEIKPEYCKKTQPEHGWYHIRYEWYTTPLEFTTSILPIIQKANDNGISIIIDANTIKVKETLSAPISESVINSGDHVSMINNNTENNNENGQFTIESVAYDNSGDIKMEESQIREIDANDVLEAIFECLPEGNCRKVFKIFLQEGHEYDLFYAKYSYDNRPKHAHIAEHLGIPIRTVKTHMEQIRLMCLRHNCIPSST